MGLAMSNSEINYLIGIYKVLKRNPSDVELMMFSQINSEHCRHKIFNSKFFIEGKKKNKNLFAMIKSTYRNNHDVISAYKDNSSIIKGKTINELVITKNLKYKKILKQLTLLYRNNPKLFGIILAIDLCIIFLLIKFFTYPMIIKINTFISVGVTFDKIY